MCTNPVYRCSLVLIFTIVLYIMLAFFCKGPLLPSCLNWEDAAKWSFITLFKNMYLILSNLYNEIYVQFRSYSAKYNVQTTLKFQSTFMHCNLRMPISAGAGSIEFLLLCWPEVTTFFPVRYANLHSLVYTLRENY